MTRGLARWVDEFADDVAPAACYRKLARALRTAAEQLDLDLQEAESKRALVRDLRDALNAYDARRRALEEETPGSPCAQERPKP